MSERAQRKARRPVTESSAFFAFLERVIRAGGRRVADQGDVEALTQLRELRRLLDEVTGSAVYSLRARPEPYSNPEIAARLGVSKQAVAQRWPTFPPDVDAITGPGHGGGTVVWLRWYCPDCDHPVIAVDHQHADAVRRHVAGCAIPPAPPVDDDGWDD